MASRISFGGYTFLFQVLTTSNAYTAEFSEPVQEGERLIFRAQEVSYGDDSGRVNALFEVSFSGSSQTVSWQARAEHSEPIKGIKVFVESLPFGKVVTPPGLRWEISESAGQCFVFPHGAYPVRTRGGETGIVFPVGPIPGMAAQFILIEGEEETVCIRTNEHPPRFKRFWAYRVEDSLEVHLNVGRKRLRTQQRAQLANLAHRTRFVVAGCRRSLHRVDGESLRLDAF